MDGLSETNYKVKDIEYNQFYTKINVEIRPAVVSKLELKMGDGQGFGVLLIFFGVIFFIFLFLDSVLQRDLRNWCINRHLSNIFLVS